MKQDTAISILKELYSDVSMSGLNAWLPTYHGVAYEEIMKLKDKKLYKLISNHGERFSMGPGIYLPVDDLWIKTDDIPKCYHLDNFVPGKISSLHQTHPKTDQNPIF